MSCSCGPTAKGFKNMPVQLAPNHQRCRMRSCVQAMEKRAMWWLFISGAQPGRPWMVARSWVTRKTRRILELPTSMTLIGCWFLPNRRRATDYLAKSRTFNGSLRMAGNLLLRAATRLAIRPRYLLSILLSTFSTCLRLRSGSIVGSCPEQALCIDSQVTIDPLFKRVDGHCMTVREIGST